MPVKLVTEPIHVKRTASDASTMPAPSRLRLVMGARADENSRASFDAMTADTNDSVSMTTATNVSSSRRQRTVRQPVVTVSVDEQWTASNDHVTLTDVTFVQGMRELAPGNALAKRIVRAIETLGDWIDPTRDSNGDCLVAAVVAPIQTNVKSTSIGDPTVPPVNAELRVLGAQAIVEFNVPGGDDDSSHIGILRRAVSLETRVNIPRTVLFTPSPLVLHVVLLRLSCAAAVPPHAVTLERYIHPVVALEDAELEPRVVQLLAPDSSLAEGIGANLQAGEHPTIACAVRARRDAAKRQTIKRALTHIADNMTMPPGVAAALPFCAPRTIAREQRHYGVIGVVMRWHPLVARTLGEAVPADAPDASMRRVQVFRDILCKPELEALVDTARIVDECGLVCDHLQTAIAIWREMTGAGASGAHAAMPVMRLFEVRSKLGINVGDAELKSMIDSMAPLGIETTDMSTPCVGVPIVINADMHRDVANKIVDWAQKKAADQHLRVLCWAHRKCGSIRELMEGHGNMHTHLPSAVRDARRAMGSDNEALAAFYNENEYGPSTATAVHFVVFANHLTDAEWLKVIECTEHGVVNIIFDPTQPCIPTHELNIASTLLDRASDLGITDADEVSDGFTLFRADGPLASAPHGTVVECLERASRAVAQRPFEPLVLCTEAVTGASGPGASELCALLLKKQSVGLFTTSATTTARAREVLSLPMIGDRAMRPLSRTSDGSALCLYDTVVLIWNSLDAGLARTVRFAAAAARYALLIVPMLDDNVNIGDAMRDVALGLNPSALSNFILKRTLSV